MKVLFVDRDGTLIEEPADEQVDSLEKIRFMPDVFASLRELVAAGWRLAIVPNQDGLGSARFPQPHFELPQRFVMAAFASQGLAFDAVCFCPHRPADGRLGHGHGGHPPNSTSRSAEDLLLVASGSTASFPQGHPDGREHFSLQHLCQHLSPMKTFGLPSIRLPTPPQC